MVTCAKCHISSDDLKDFHRVISISGGIMGDEYIETYFFVIIAGFILLRSTMTDFWGRMKSPYGVRFPNRKAMRK